MDLADKILAAAIPSTEKPGQKVEAQAGGRKPRLPRSEEAFGKVPIERLFERGWDDVYDARTRVWIFLEYKTGYGQWAHQFTNDDARRLGLDRHHKMREIRWLEHRGRISVQINGNRVPWISLSTRNDTDSAFLITTNDTALHHE